MLGKLYLAMGVTALAGFIAGPALAFARIVSPLAGFALYSFGSFLAAIVVLIGLGIVLFKGPKRSLIAAGLAVIPSAILAYGLVLAREYPAINDISTDRNNPPPFKFASQQPEHAGRDWSFPEGNAEIIAEAYPHIGTVRFLDPVPIRFSKALEIAESRYGWTITQQYISSAESVFEGYAETSIFRFHDDIVVRVRKAGPGCVVDIRSKSRDGQGDFGANAKRIRQFIFDLHS